MIITIDTKKIAEKLIENSGWELKDFGDNDAPSGWTNALVDLVPEYESAVFDEVINVLEDKAFDHKNAKAEVIRRFIKNEENCSLADSIEWFEDCEIVTTRKAFQLAKADKSVIQLFADGTDTQLEDSELEHDYFPDKSKSWPEIETIFILERSELNAKAN